MSKKKFIIPCYWEMYGNIEIEAETVEDAVLIAEDPEQCLPLDSSYVSNSFHVDHEVVASYNDEEDLGVDDFDVRGYKVERGA